MATVYKAKCHVLNRYVAVKILRDEFTTDQEFIKRFEVEAQSAASITHPNIVSVYDVGVDGNLHYIVMELVQGKTLKEIITEEGGPLPWKWSVNIAIQIASALEIAHKNNIVHRDIKPHNIIITEDGVAKVTDFGIAKAVSNSTITAFGTTIGSVHYFSPEHARGGYTDYKSDLYSLGVVMYEMLTGKVPFDADTPVSVALKHMQEDPIEPIKVNPNIPIAVNNIIMKALKKDANQRYSSSTEMLKDLNRALKDPQGNFVDVEDETQDFPTQKISTVYDDKEPKQNRNKNGKKEGKLKQFIKNHKKLSIVIGIILLFALSLGGTMLALNLTNPKEVQIPNLVGLTAEEAQKTLEELNIKYEVQEEQFNTEYPAGTVISQDPAYMDNFMIKEKSTIRVILSKGAEKATVPKVVGMEQTEAVQAIEDANLVADVQEETSRTVEQGYVIRQEQEEGEELNAGDTVTIYVSSGTGIEQVTVPSLVGKTENEARAALSNAGLKANIANDEDTTKDDGVVLKQSVDAGKVVDEGTTVTITINKVAEAKNATITVNVGQILGTSETEDSEEEPENVKVEVEVTSGDGSGFTKSNVSRTGTITGTVTGKGQVTLRLRISDSTGTLSEQSHSMNLNNESAYSFR